MKTSDEFTKALAALNVGRPVIMPTDTVYGIGVAVGLASSPQIIYDLKKRDADKAIPWLVGRQSALNLYGQDVSAAALKLAQKFWPGPLTIIVKAASNVPVAFRADDGTIALRMPEDVVALKLINAVGFPMATSSANIQGDTPPRSFDEINPALKDQVAAVLGDDTLRQGVSSTVVSCVGETPVILREGPITLEEIEACIQR